MTTVGVKLADGSTAQIDVEDVGGGVLQVVHRFAAPSSFQNGRIASGGAGAAVQGGSQAATQGVWVKALSSNVSTCYVGNANSVDDTNGWELLVGEEHFVPVDDLSKVWVYFVGAADEVCVEVA